MEVLWHKKNLNTVFDNIIYFTIHNIVNIHNKIGYFKFTLTFKLIFFFFYIKLLLVYSVINIEIHRFDRLKYIKINK